MRSDPSEDPEERLARFREQWKAEVALKRKQALHPYQPTKEDLLNQVPSSSQSQNAPTSPTIEPVSSQDKEKDRWSSVSTSRIAAGPSHFAIAGQTKYRVSAANGTFELTEGQQAAVQIYRKAVTCEQRGDFDEAIQLYKRAFRMEPNVDDFHYMLEAQQYATGAHDRPVKHHKHGVSGATSKDVERVTQGLQALDMSAHAPVKLPASHGVVSRTLASIVETWPNSLTFDPEDEEEPIPINTLPDELLVHILLNLDITSLERFAAVNRKARVVSLDTHIWRDHVQAVYKPPQIPDEEELETLVEDYISDYRRVFIEHPRLRIDGVYIAVCHYTRTGHSENAWVNISHFITYHRYLRFYPDGQVLSLLTNEEASPRHIIPLLKPTLRMTNFYIGTWRLQGTTVHISTLTDPSNPDARYTFQMTLELRSRPVLGRWNRLDIVNYDSVEVESGEAVPVNLKHDKPYWFSKVRSFGGF